MITRKTQTPPFWHTGICPLVWLDPVPLSEFGRTAPGSTWQTESSADREEVQRWHSSFYNHIEAEKGPLITSCDILLKMTRYVHAFAELKLPSSYTPHSWQILRGRGRRKPVTGVWKLTEENWLFGEQSSHTGRSLLSQVSQLCTATLPVCISKAKP